MQMLLPSVQVQLQVEQILLQVFLAQLVEISSIAIGKGASITAPTAGTTLGGQDSIAIGSSASAQQHSSISVGLGV